MKIKKKLLSFLILLITIGFFLTAYQISRAEPPPIFSFSLAKNDGNPSTYHIDINKPVDTAERKTGEVVDLVINFNSQSKKVKSKNKDYAFVFYYNADKMSQTFCQENNFTNTICAYFDPYIKTIAENPTKSLEKLDSAKCASKEMPKGCAKVTIKFKLKEDITFPRENKERPGSYSYFFLAIEGMKIKNDASGDLDFKWDYDESRFPETSPHTVAEGRTDKIITTGEIQPPVKLDMPNLSCETTDSGVKWSWKPVDGGVNYLLYVYSIATDEKPLGSEGKWFTTTKEAIAGRTPDIKYQGNLNAYDANKNPESKSFTSSKSCKMPAAPVVVEPPTVTITPSKATKATLKLGVRMPDISVGSVETVLVKISDFADQEITLTKKEKDYFIGDLAFENLSDKQTFSIYVKKENVTIGRKFNDITLKPEEKLDCATYNTNTNCGTLLDQQETFYSENNGRILLSGDADGDNEIEFDDYDLLSQNYNKTQNIGDFDLNGNIEFDDYDILSRNYTNRGDSQ